MRLAYLAATLIWIVWALRLAFGKNIKWRLRSWRGPLFLLLTGLALYSIWSVYALSRHLAAYSAEQAIKYHPILTQLQRLGEIDMPVGTKLTLAVALQPQSFTRAEFPHPISMGGVDVLIAERYLSMHTDEAYRSAGFTPLNLRVTGLGTAHQAGWHCDATRVITFETQPNGAIQAFQSCTASLGNLVEGQPLPPGSEIIVSEGSLSLDGQRGLDRWLIHLAPDVSFSLQGQVQSGGALLLDAERKVIKRILP